MSGEIRQRAPFLVFLSVGGRPRIGNEQSRFVENSVAVRQIVPAPPHRTYPVSRIFTSWNGIREWLGRLEQLRSVA